MASTGFNFEARRAGKIEKIMDSKNVSDEVSAMFKGVSFAG